MKLIVGLGNPGNQYKSTRHNAGFLALDVLQKIFAPDHTFQDQKKIHGEIVKGKYERTGVILLKPNTFMNASGTAVQAALQFFKLTSNDLLVIHDDKDFLLGQIRLQKNRGPAGHNGIRSIIDLLGTQDFARIRIGVAPVNPIVSTADFVLGPFTAAEKKVLGETLDHVTQTVKTWIVS